MGYLSTKITGALTSRFSALLLATASTLVFIVSLLIPMLGYQHAALFISLFLGASYSRLVSSSVVTMQFPNDRQRAGFSSLQTSIMYLLTTVAFFLICLFITCSWHDATKCKYVTGGMCNFSSRVPNIGYYFAKEAG